MKINHIDPVSLRVLRTSLDEALRAVGQKHGLAISSGKASYDRAGKFGAFKVDVALIGDGGAVQSREAEDYKRHAVMFGLKPEFLNQSFTDSRGTRYMLVGFNAKASKKPFLIRDDGGKSFVCGEEMIRHGFRGQLVASAPAVPAVTTG
jgi:hypothetical protein